MEDQRQIAVRVMKFIGEEKAEEEHLFPNREEFSWVVGIKYSAERNRVTYLHYEGAIRMVSRKRPSAMNRAYPAFTWSATDESYHEMRRVYRDYACLHNCEFVDISYGPSLPNDFTTPTRATSAGEWQNFRLEGLDQPCVEDGSFSVLEEVIAPTLQREERVGTVTTPTVRESLSGTSKATGEAQPVDEVMATLTQASLCDRKGNTRAGTLYEPSISLSVTTDKDRESIPSESPVEESVSSMDASISRISIDRERFRVEMPMDSCLVTVDLERQELIDAILLYCQQHHIVTRAVAYQH